MIVVYFDHVAMIAIATYPENSEYANNGVSKNLLVVYFDQQTGAPHTVRRSK